MLIGGGFGAVAARKVKMTAMPQMVALFNGVGGGAAALISLAELHRILPEPGTPKVDICARDRPLGAHRRDLLRRLDGRVREAPGADRRPADHVRGPAVRQRRALPRRARAAGIALVAGVQDEWLLWVDRRRRARLRRPVRAADRRRRHAGRDLAAERVHRPRRRARRLRAREQRAHRRRHARRRVRHAADAHDGRGR